ncbi:hypothetical protein RRG08_014567 [Elysia crispata]|uniref:Uncharacterized protein n=1 Tax=Elysia crispata TaxID=231223 RepID=A0AAE1ATG0_9GAST|nr:hypothetical protein RRG08_014567 [Elysia crispata]
MLRCQDMLPNPHKRTLWFSIMCEDKIALDVNQLWYLLRNPIREMFRDCIHVSYFIIGLVRLWEASIPEKSQNIDPHLINEFTEILLVIRWPLGSCCGYSYVMFSSDGRLDYSAFSKHQINETVSSSRLHSDFVSKMPNRVLFQMKSV